MQPLLELLRHCAESHSFDSGDPECKPTDYAVANRAYVNRDNGNCWWWLRSPGNNQDNAAYITDDGTVYLRGYGVYRVDRAVRPAMWIDLSE